MVDVMPRMGLFYANRGWEKSSGKRHLWIKGISKNYTEVGSTSSRMRIMIYETVLSVYRGRVYMWVAGSGGGTRYARLPPVIAIIPRSGYLSLHSLYVIIDEIALCHPMVEK